MIFKLISRIGNETFAALVGTEKEDQFILQSADVIHTFKTITGSSHWEMQSDEILTVPIQSIGFTNGEAAYLFRKWQEDSFYAFGKSNYELHDYAHQSVAEIPDKKRPFEGMVVFRRISIRPLVVVNIKKYPQSMQQLINISNSAQLLLRTPGGSSSKG